MPASLPSGPSGEGIHDLPPVTFGRLHGTRKCQRPPAVTGSGTVPASGQLNRATTNLLRRRGCQAPRWSAIRPTSCQENRSESLLSGDAEALEATPGQAPDGRCSGLGGRFGGGVGRQGVTVRHLGRGADERPAVVPAGPAAAAGGAGQLLVLDDFGDVTDVAPLPVEPRRSVLTRCCW